MEKIEQSAGMTSVDTLKFSVFINAGKSCKRGLVYKWHARLSNGRENIADDDCDGRTKTTEMVRSGIEKRSMKKDYLWTRWSFWNESWNCLLYYKKMNWRWPRYQHVFKVLHWDLVRGKAPWCWNRITCVSSRQCSSSSCTGNHHHRAEGLKDLKQRLELSQRTGFPRCTLNGLGDMKNASRQGWILREKLKKTVSVMMLVQSKWPCMYDGVWLVCIVYVYTCSVYASCVKFYLWSANIFLVMITKNPQLSMILFLSLKACQELFWLPLVRVVS